MPRKPAYTLAHPELNEKLDALLDQLDEALDRAAAGFQKALDNHGPESVYGVASGRAPNEAAYTMQKFIRAGFGTNQIDNCSRA